MPDWLTVQEAARHLRLKPRTLYHLVAKAAIPFTKASGRLLFNTEQLDAWVASQSQAARPQGNLPPILAGSHDPLLDWAVRHSQCRLGLSSLGSSDGLDRVARSEACAALIHLPDLEGDGYNQQAMRHRLAGLPVAAVRWAGREQGLLVRKGNPLRLRTLRDLTRPKVRLVMRQPGAGSHLLLGKLLTSLGITTRQLQVIDAFASSETEVADAIADGHADVGFAVRAAARPGSLAFVPIAWEQVDLVFWQRSYFETPMQQLLMTARSPEFAAQAERLGGYRLSQAGEVTFSGLAGT
ncbi:MAG: helix-turn-helix transcriptional regulator [Burkholderiaceae bacterium]